MSDKGICFYCGKVIRGKSIIHSPTLLEILCGSKKEKEAHRQCYKKYFPNEHLTRSKTEGNS